MSEVQPRHNPERSRFEVEVEGHTGVLDYRLRDDTVTFTHTGVPKEIGGRGVGGALARSGLEWARDEGLSVIPQCPFIHTWIQRHPEFAEIVSEEYDRRDELTGED